MSSISEDKMGVMTEVYCRFIAKAIGERILKIGQHLAKLQTNNIVGVFDSQCRRNMSVYLIGLACTGKLSVRIVDERCIIKGYFHNSSCPYVMHDTKMSSAAVTFVVLMLVATERYAAALHYDTTANDSQVGVVSD